MMNPPLSRSFWRCCSRLTRTKRNLIRGRKMNETTNYQFAPFPEKGTFIGRVQLPDRLHPSIATIRNGIVYDITSRDGPTVSDICELDDPASYVQSQTGFP